SVVEEEEEADYKYSCRGRLVARTNGGKSSYLRWKLRCLMARKKRKAKRPMAARWRQVTISRSRPRRPRYPSRNSRTVCSPTPGTRICSVRSPSCENMSPYTVHAAGSAQYTHRHHTGISCRQAAREDVPEDEDEERQAHGDLDVGGQRHRHHPYMKLITRYRKNHRNLPAANSKPIIGYTMDEKMSTCTSM
ncbi:hypothetical protein U9M48_037937, partial [Paspalum notatum var. saurae]